MVGCRTPPDQAARSSTSSSFEAGRHDVVRPEAAGQIGLGVEAGDDGDLARRGAAPGGWRSRTGPATPAPHTRTRPPGGGGWRVMLCRDTANGSANTACSSSIASGTAKSIVEWAGISSAYPPVASLETPVWMPALMSPVVKLQQRLTSPAAQAGQSGLDARVVRSVSQGLSTTRWPTSKPSCLGSELDHLGHHLVAHAPGGRSTARSSRCRWSPSPKSSRICLESEPQIPVSRGRVTSQSGRSGRASGTSRRATGGDAEVAGRAGLLPPAVSTRRASRRTRAPSPPTSWSRHRPERTKRAPA